MEASVALPGPQFSPPLHGGNKKAANELRGHWMSNSQKQWQSDSQARPMVTSLEKFSTTQTPGFLLVFNAAFRSYKVRHWPQHFTHQPICHHFLVEKL